MWCHLFRGFPLELECRHGGNWKRSCQAQKVWPPLEKLQPQCHSQCGASFGPMCRKKKNIGNDMLSLDSIPVVPMLEFCRFQSWWAPAVCLPQYRGVWWRCETWVPVLWTQCRPTETLSDRETRPNHLEIWIQDTKRKYTESTSVYWWNSTTWI